MGESSDYTVNPGNDPSDPGTCFSGFCGEISNVAARTHKLVQDLTAGQVAVRSLEACVWEVSAGAVTHDFNMIR